jgi:hypothetical protein
MNQQEWSYHGQREPNKNDEERYSECGLNGFQDFRSQKSILYQMNLLFQSALLTTIVTSLVLDGLGKTTDIGFK